METKGELRIHGLICPKCEEIIYSVHRHDYHFCSCGLTMVDGGFDYMRCGFGKNDPKYTLKDLKSISFTIKATKEDLYNDYNNSSIKKWNRKFGRIPKDKRSELFDVLFTK